MSAAAHKLALRVVWVPIALSLAASPARAAEVTRVVSALDDEDRFDLNVTLSWLHEAKSALVKRELQSGLPPGTSLIKDSRYNQTRDVLNLRADIGILWDVGLFVQAPLVLRDVRGLDFDQSEGGNCVYPTPGGPPATCVNQFNSTILRDGILPGFEQSAYGLDAEHDGRAFMDPQPGVFRGPVRRGFENLGVGINWAAFNQARDVNRPTWLLGFEAKLDIFTVMRFDPANPKANTAVGPGYHQLIWSTFISKRFRHFDPYFGAWYMLPIRTNGSPFQEYAGGNQGAVDPQHRAGIVAGFEQIAWENPRGDQRVTIEVRGRAEQRFYGVSRTEIWEPLSGSSACRTDAAQCRLQPLPGTPAEMAGVDQDLDGDGDPDPHPGVTETQAYGIFGGDVGLNVQVGRHVRFRGLFGLTVDMPHFLTYANSGVDRNRDGRVNTGDRAELNPVYRETIDLPGRRFKVEGTQIWSLFLEGSLLF